MSHVGSPYRDAKGVGVQFAFLSSTLSSPESNFPLGTPPWHASSVCPEVGMPMPQDPALCRHGHGQVGASGNALPPAGQNNRGLGRAEVRAARCCGPSHWLLHRASLIPGPLAHPWPRGSLTSGRSQGRAGRDSLRPSDWSRRAWASCLVPSAPGAGAGCPRAAEQSESRTTSTCHGPRPPAPASGTCPGGREVHACVLQRALRERPWDPPRHMGTKSLGVSQPRLQPSGTRRCV